MIYVILISVILLIVLIIVKTLGSKTSNSNVVPNTYRTNSNRTNSISVPNSSFETTYDRIIDRNNNTNNALLNSKYSFAPKNTSKTQPDKRILVKNTNVRKPKKSVYHNNRYGEDLDKISKLRDPNYNSSKPPQIGLTTEDLREKLKNNAERNAERGIFKFRQKNAEAFAKLHAKVNLNSFDNDRAERALEILKTVRSEHNNFSARAAKEEKDAQKHNRQRTV